MPTRTDIDTDWFYRRIAARDMSLREVARAIAMDPTALSRTLRGQRRLQMGEVENLARTLDVGVEDVLRHAGLPGLGGAAAPNAAGSTLPVAAPVPAIAHLVDADGRVTPLADGRPLPPGPAADVAALMAARSLTTARVALVSARTGPLALIDQALLLAAADPRSGGGAADGSLCLVADEGGESVARLDRTLKYGDASLTLIDGSTVLRSIDALQPILAVLP